MRELILEDIDTRSSRETFIKLIVTVGFAGAFIGVILFVLKNQESLTQNPYAMEIIMVSVIVLFVGLYLINKSQMDFI